jgi:hypothetical protein
MKPISKNSNYSEHGFENITSNNYEIDVTNLYNQLKIMNIFDIIFYYSNVYIYKSLHKLNSFLSANFFKLMNRSQRRRSTQRQMLALPKCKFNDTQNSIFYKGVQSWNSLDIEVRSSSINILENCCLLFTEELLLGYK